MKPATMFIVTWFYILTCVNFIIVTVCLHDFHNAEMAQMKKIEKQLIVQHAEIEAVDPTGVCWEAEDADEH
jgi:hypothetical protein